MSSQGHDMNPAAMLANINTAFMQGTMSFQDIRTILQDGHGFYMR